MVAAGSLVAREGALIDLVAGGFGEPTLKVLTDREPPRVREQDALGLVGECLNLFVVGLLGGRAVEAYPPATRVGVSNVARLS